MSNNTGLRRTSSLVIDASTRLPAIRERGDNDVGKEKPAGKDEVIVIPDSEEENDRA